MIKHQGQTLGKPFLGIGETSKEWVSMKRFAAVSQADIEHSEPGGDPSPGGCFVVKNAARNMPVTTKLTLREKQAAEAAARNLDESRSGLLRLALLHFLDLKSEARVRYAQVQGDL